MMHPGCGWIVFSFFLVVTSVSGSSFLHEYCPDQVIVKFRPDTSSNERQRVMDEMGCWVAREGVHDDFLELYIPPHCSPQEMVDQFATHSEVLYAELNYIARGFLDPDDTFFSFQWHLDANSPGNINIQSAWNLQTGDPCVIIAVIDTGIAYETRAGFVQAPDLAETRFVAGFDFANGDAFPNDDNGHGTHVAGTIAQSTNNGLGVAGVAFDCSVMPVKSLGANNSGTFGAVADGVLFAASNGAKVINMSLGGTGNSITLANAIQSAHAQGATIVCSAGNEFFEGNPTIYPAAYPECIAVGAIRLDETRAPYSSTGFYVDLAAPGGDLAVDQNGDGYGDGVLQQTFELDPTNFAYYFFQGTSMASPHVAGVAGLLVSNGVTKPEKVREALEGTARDLGPAGWDAEYGWGLVDAYAALTYAVDGDVTGDLCVLADDVQAMAAVWLFEGVSSADLDGDLIVNYADFAELAANWAP